MSYQFDMTKLTIGDYIDIQPPAQPSVILQIAEKCSLTDTADIPITDLTVFLEEFSKSLSGYISTQFLPP